FRLFPRLFGGGLFVVSAELHLAENALALHLLLERLEGLVDIVVANENLHALFLSLRGVSLFGRSRASSGQKRLRGLPSRARLYQKCAQESPGASTWARMGPARARSVPMEPERALDSWVAHILIDEPVSTPIGSGASFRRDMRYSPRPSWRPIHGVTIFSK